MRPSRILLLFCIIVLTADAALAATLHGTIYDIELNELDNVVVEVDSEPVQRFMSRDGGYSFTLGPGEYTLTANYTKDDLHRYSVEEKISIAEEGEFIYDLFLFPGFDDEDVLITDPDEELAETVFDEDRANYDFLIGVVAFLFIVVIVLLYFLLGKYKKKAVKEELKAVDVVKKQARAAGGKPVRKKAAKKSEGHERADTSKAEHHDIDDDLQSIVRFMKKEGGRTTQKELRKQIPLSEAKISLMVSELEHKGVVEKVKKGRGNIIILRKS
ncbi:helix-turn-helix transcriptional regulator [Nanoarchaeota archaeon]